MSEPASHSLPRRSAHTPFPLRIGADPTHVILRCEEGLPSWFIRRLWLHPLLDFVLAEDELFGDPFGQSAPSAR